MECLELEVKAAKSAAWNLVEELVKARVSLDQEDDGLAQYQLKFYKAVCKSPYDPILATHVGP